MEQLGTRTPAEIDQWVGSAPVGESFVYAIVDLEDRPPALLMKHARKIYEGGFVGLNQRRSSGRVEYLMRRLAKRAVEAPPVNGGFAPAATPEGRILAELRRAARTAAPCPSNDHLARIAELPDSFAASYVVRKLRDAGKISVAFVGPRQRRQITIRSSGKQTGLALA